jgi:hypothetical protein
MQAMTAALRAPVALAVLLATSAVLPATATDVTTQHNDHFRTGANLSETTLTPATVRGRGLDAVMRALDGNLETQPLYVRGVSVDGAARNIVFATTMVNSVYAFDADDRSPALTAAVVWRRTLADPAPDVRPWPRGISSTPVIDMRPGRRGMYVVYSTTSDRNWKSDNALQEVTHVQHIDVAYYLVKLDLATGAVIAGPARLTGSFARSDGQVVAFVARDQVDRPALLLDHGYVYMGFGMRPREEAAPYHGWILRYDADTLTPRGAFTTSPYAYAWNLRTHPAWNPIGCYESVNGRAEDWGTSATGWYTAHNGGVVNRCPAVGSGIWQGGGGLAADRHGNIYFTVGNGHYDPTQQSYGNGVVKLSSDAGGLHVAASFAPEAHLAELEQYDVDLGSGGTMIVDGANRVIAGGKSGLLYNLELGTLAKVQGYLAGYNQYTNAMTPAEREHYRFQTWNVGPHFHGSPTFYRAADTYGYIYEWAEKDYLKRYRFDVTRGRIVGNPVAPWDLRGTVLAAGCTPPGAPGSDCSPMPGGMLSFSSNGRLPATGIVWAILRRHADDAGRMVSDSVYAFDARTLAQLWRADIPGIPHWMPPTVADGKVFAATGGQRLAIFALNSPIKVPLPLKTILPFDPYDVEWERAAMMIPLPAPEAVQPNALAKPRAMVRSVPDYSQDALFRARLAHAAIVPPGGGLLSLYRLHVRGSETYRCDPVQAANAACRWTDAGIDGSYDDGSPNGVGKIEGTDLVGSSGETLKLGVLVERPWDGAASWQLLQVVGSAPSSFAGARYAQRTKTIGGAPPARAGKPGETVRVPVRALYTLLVQGK